jgi:hypothetical protein
VSSLINFAGVWLIAFQQSLPVHSFLLIRQCFPCFVSQTRSHSELFACSLSSSTFFIHFLVRFFLFDLFFCRSLSVALNPESKHLLRVTFVLLTNRRFVLFLLRAFTFWLALSSFHATRFLLPVLPSARIFRCLASSLPASSPSSSSQPPPSCSFVCDAHLAGAISASLL